MPPEELKPKSERLRSALRWLSDRGPPTRALIDECARRHDLSPLEADFLLREYLSRRTDGDD